MTATAGTTWEDERISFEETGLVSVLVGSLGGSLWPCFVQLWQSSFHLFHSLKVCPLLQSAALQLSSYPQESLLVSLSSPRLSVRTFAYLCPPPASAVVPLRVWMDTRNINPNSWLKIQSSPLLTFLLFVLYQVWKWWHLHNFMAAWWYLAHPTIYSKLWVRSANLFPPKASFLGSHWSLILSDRGQVFPLKSGR